MSVQSSKKTFLDVFPVPEFLLLSTAGVSLGEDDIKFVELKRQFFGTGLTLSHLSHEDGHDAPAALKRFAKRYGNKFILATLPEEKSYLFIATIDRVAPEGLNEAVAFIIEENVPVSLAEAVFDYEVIQDDEISPQMRLAVTVVPRSLVDAQIQLFEASGLVPISFDIESRAAARAVIPKKDLRTHIIVNLASKKTGFYVVEDKVVQFSTTHNAGVEESTLSDLRTELRKVLSFWNAKAEDSRGSGRKVEKALLCGIRAGDEETVARLMHDCGVEYAIADVWVNAHPSRSNVPKTAFDQHLDYASTIGLVLGRGK